VVIHYCEPSNFICYVDTPSLLHSGDRHSYSFNFFTPELWPKAWDGDEPEAQLIGTSNVGQSLLKRGWCLAQPVQVLVHSSSSTDDPTTSTAIQISAVIASQVVNQTLVTHAITHCHQSDMLRGLSLFKDVFYGTEICGVCWMLNNGPYHVMA
jgi:hypothetical protein